MTAQEYIELIAKKIDDGSTFPAYRKTYGLYESGECFYGSCEHPGKHCFIGVLIPEDHPAQNQDGNVYTLLQEYPDVYQYMPKDLTDIQLSKIQKVHDYYACMRSSNSQLFKEKKQEIIEWLKDIVEEKF